MRKLLATSISLLALGGCVTESTYVGSDKPVVEKKINNVEAARTRISLALNYLAQGDSTQAKYNLERAAKFAPELPEVHYSMAYYYQKVGETQRAKDAYDKALSIEPNDPNTLNNYGVFLCDIGEYEAAVDKFMAAIEVPSYLRVAESYENLALCALEFDKFDAAEAFLEDSLQHSSLRPTSLINLAAVKYAKSDFHHAQQVLKRYERTGRVSSRSLLLNYLIEERMGHIEVAQNIAKTIAVTYPTSIEARIVREQKYSASEFEQLREQYRRHQINELQSSMNGQTIVAKPKIKVVKKKAPQAVQEQTVTQTNSDAQVESAAVITVATPTPEPIVENVVTQNTTSDARDDVTMNESQTMSADVTVVDNTDTQSNDAQQSEALANQTSVTEDDKAQPVASTQSELTEPTESVAAQAATPADDVVEDVTQTQSNLTELNESAAEKSNSADEAVTQLVQSQDTLVETGEEVSLAQPEQGAAEGETDNMVAQPELETSSVSVEANDKTAETAQNNVEQAVQSGEEKVLESSTQTAVDDVVEQVQEAQQGSESAVVPSEQEQSAADIQNEGSNERWIEISEQQSNPAAETSEVVEQQKDALQSELAREFAAQTEIPQSAIQEQPSTLAENEESAPALSESAEEVTSDVQEDTEQSANKVAALSTDSGETPYHVMGKGETLFSVSARYNIRLSTLKEWNNLKSVDRVRSGQKIYLARPYNYHTVKDGETLSEISKEYNILMQRLIEWNQLEEGAKLVPGDKIYLVEPKNLQL